MGRPTRPAAAAEAPPCPDEVAYLVAWFRDCCLSRPAGAFAPGRLSPGLIVETVRLLHYATPRPWELRALLRLDLAWLAARPKPPPKGGKDKPPPTPPPPKRRR